MGFIIVRDVTGWRLDRHHNATRRLAHEQRPNWGAGHVQRPNPRPILSAAGQAAACAEGAAGGSKRCRRGGKGGAADRDGTEGEKSDNLLHCHSPENLLRRFRDPPVAVAAMAAGSCALRHRWRRAKTEEARSAPVPLRSLASGRSSPACRPIGTSVRSSGSRRACRRSTRLPRWSRDRSMPRPPIPSRRSRTAARQGSSESGA